MYAVAFRNVIGRDPVSVPLENVNSFRRIQSEETGDENNGCGKDEQIC